MRKTTNSLSQDDRCPGRDSNGVRNEYVSDISELEIIFSVALVMYVIFIEGSVVLFVQEAPPPFRCGASV
jgi:hypothetical protein